MQKIETNESPKIFWHDRLLAKTILKLIPYSVKPNYITIFRLIATPLVALLMFYKHYSWGLWAFIIVASTDFIDGSMARTRNQVSKWGSIYDPVADKILIGSMVFIIVLRYIDLWTALLIVFLELVIIITAWVRLRHGYKIQANIWGKIKMTLQVMGVTILLLSVVYNWAALVPLASGTLYLAIAFAVVSLLTYGI